MTYVFARNILLKSSGIEFENVSSYLNGDARSQAEQRDRENKMHGSILKLPFNLYRRPSNLKYYVTS
jgi:hypothetical protein